MSVRIICTAIVAAVMAATGVAYFGPTAPASSSAYYERMMIRELKGMRRELDAIKYNTGAVCQDSPNGYSCQKF